MPNLVVFSGNAHPQFAQKVVSHLHIPLGAASVGQFSDGEISVEITENVRGKDVFIVQPTCAPTNDNLMEILVMADALRRASAGRITAVIPYFVMLAKTVVHVLHVCRSQRKLLQTCLPLLVLTVS